jgi:hypothetical protein
LSESEVQQLILMEAPRHQCHLMRNNSGAFKDATGRWVRYVLMNHSKKQNDKIKSSDLIGFRVIDNGSIYVAQFVAIECKETGFKFNPEDQRQAAQKAFIDYIIKHGGIAGFCDSVESFQNLMSSD